MSRSANCLPADERVPQVVLLDDHGRERRDDADHRPDLHRHGVPGRRDQPVVVEPVGLVPQALTGKGVADGGEVLEELEHEVRGGPLPRLVQHGGDGGHGDRVGAHPAGGVGLLKGAADWQVRAVERADVVKAEEAALEDVVAFEVLPVDPPGEVDQQLVEDPAEEVDVAAAVDREHLERGPRLHRRVHVGEVPLVGGQRPVRVLEPLTAQQEQLVLGEPGIDVRQRHAVEGQVPRRVPRVLPLVRHRHDVEGVEVPPPRVAAAEALSRGRRLAGSPSSQRFTSK